MSSVNRLFCTQGGVDSWRRREIITSLPFRSKDFLATSSKVAPLCPVTVFVTFHSFLQRFDVLTGSQFSFAKDSSVVAPCAAMKLQKATTKASHVVTLLVYSTRSKSTPTDSKKSQFALHTRPRSAKLAGSRNAPRTCKSMLQHTHVLSMMYDTTSAAPG